MYSSLPSSVLFLLEEGEALANYGSFTWNIRTNSIEYSRNLLRIFGLLDERAGPADVLGHILRITNVKDKSPLMGFPSRGPYKNQERDFKITLPSGEERMLHLKALTFDNDLLVGFIKDITSEHNRIHEINLQKDLMGTAEKLSGTGAWRMNLQTGEIHYSENVLQLLKITREKMGTRDISAILESFIYKEDLDSVRATIENSLRDKKEFMVDYRVERGDGNIRWIRSACCKYDGDMAYGFLQDITREKEQFLEKDIHLQKESHQRLQTELQLEAIFQNAPVGLFMIDQEKRFKRINNLMAKINGLSIEDHLGKSMSDVHTAININSRDTIEKVLRGEEVNGMVSSTIGENGEESYWMCSYYPLKLAGKITGLIGVVQDISEIKRKEKLLLELTHDLREKQSTLNDTLRSVTNQKERLLEFSQMVSHNLRGPVAGMVGLAPLLRDAESKEEWLEYLTLMDSCIHKLSDSLDTLTDALKVQMHMDIQVTEVDINETIDKVLGLFMTSIQIDNIKVERDLEVSKIMYNKEYLEAIITNLVSNGIKYRKPNEPPHIHIRTWMESGTPYMSFKDHGLGIDLERHGQNMFKLSKTFHGNKDAKGVGLFMIKSQVDAMGGTVTVNSKPGEYTEFIIDLTAPTKR